MSTVIIDRKNEHFTIEIPKGYTQILRGKIQKDDLVYVKGQGFRESYWVGSFIENHTFFCVIRKTKSVRMG